MCFSFEFYLRNKQSFLCTLFENYFSYIFICVPDGHVHTMHIVDEGGNQPSFICKIVNSEEVDKETLHLLVFLLMQFLSRQDQVRLIYI